MKWLISILALLVLFALSVPVMGAESAPPGEIAIELSSNIGPFDPVPAVDKMSVFSTPFQVDIFPFVSTDQSQHQDLMGAHDHAYCVRATLLSLTRFTTDTVQPAALRLWRSKGGDGYGDGPKPAARVLVT